RRIDRVHALAVAELGRDGGIVDQRMQLAALPFEAMTDFSDGDADVFLVGEVHLDVVFRSGRPWAVFGERLPRTGDDAPPFARKALDGGMADAAARARQHDGFSDVRLGHVSISGRTCSRTKTRLRAPFARPAGNSQPKRMAILQVRRTRLSSLILRVSSSQNRFPLSGGVH